MEILLQRTWAGPKNLHFNQSRPALGPWTTFWVALKEDLKIL